MDNVSEIVAGGLCTGCGACVGVCPTDAVILNVVNGVFLPEVVKGKCTGCRLCVRCCPGSSNDFEELSARIFGETSKDSYLGNYLSCYVGHVRDKEILEHSTSGGIATQLLVFALEKKMIDGALVVRMNVDKPLVPEPFVARTKEEIVSASNTKYCPVPLDIGLKAILESNGKFAVVGLPCQIHGIRLAERVFPKLRAKIALHVGLFCGHTVNFAGTDLLLRKFGVNENDVAALDYRGTGWPGSMFIRLKTGKDIRIRFNRGWNAYWNVFSPFFFTPLRCMMCPDHFNDLSDVSVGDAWLRELTSRSRGLGESLLITRTVLGESLVESMKNASLLSVQAVTPKKVREAQDFALDFKKEKLAGRLSFLRAIGKKIPYINPKPRSSGPSAWVSAFLAYTSFWASSNKWLRTLLTYVPLPVFRLYFGLFKCLSLV